MKTSFPLTPVIVQGGTPPSSLQPKSVTNRPPFPSEAESELVKNMERAMSPTNSTKGTTDSVSDGRVTPETAVVDETSDAVATADERKELTNDVPEIQEASRALWTADEVVGSSSTAKVDTKADRKYVYLQSLLGKREKRHTRKRDEGEG